VHANGNHPERPAFPGWLSCVKCKDSTRKKSRPRGALGRGIESWCFRAFGGECRHRKPGHSSTAGLHQPYRRVPFPCSCSHREPGAMSPIG